MSTGAISDSADPGRHLYTLGCLPSSSAPRYYTVHMSTEQMLRTESTSLNDTLETAMQIGRKLRGGEVIELRGDLGTGKTAFVRGLVQEQAVTR